MFTRCACAFAAFASMRRGLCCLTHRASVPQRPWECCCILYALLVLPALWAGYKFIDLLHDTHHTLRSREGTVSSCIAATTMGPLGEVDPSKVAELDQAECEECFGNSTSVLMLYKGGHYYVTVLIGFLAVVAIIAALWLVYRAASLRNRAFKLLSFGIVFDGSLDVRAMVALGTVVALMIAATTLVVVNYSATVVAVYGRWCTLTQNGRLPAARNSFYYVRPVVPGELPSACRLALRRRQQRCVQLTCYSLAYCTLFAGFTFIVTFIISTFAPFALFLRTVTSFIFAPLAALHLGSLRASEARQAVAEHVTHKVTSSQVNKAISLHDKSEPSVTPALCNFMLVNGFLRRLGPASDGDDVTHCQTGRAADREEESGVALRTPSTASATKCFTAHPKLQEFVTDSMSLVRVMRGLLAYSLGPYDVFARLVGRI